MLVLCFAFISVVLVVLFVIAPAEIDFVCAEAVFVMVVGVDVLNAECGIRVALPTPAKV